MLKFIIRAAAALAVAAAAVAPGALAAGKAKHPEHQHWHWDGPFGMHDRGQLQRGLAVYKQVCSTCHGMKLLSYRHLGEKGGPLAAVAPKKWQEKGVQPELGAEGHGKYLVSPVDNPFVKALAADFQVSELDQSTGEEVTRPARPADRFVYPYPNEATGRLANGGAYPPDFSVIVKARHYGPDYIYSLLTGYGQEPPKGTDLVEGKHWNPYFAGGWIAMADQLGPQVEAGAIEYADGTPVTKEQVAKDVVAFLTWAADPHMEARKSLGLQVLAYLLILSVLLFIAYKQVWRGVKH